MTPPLHPGITPAEAYQLGHAQGYLQAAIDALHICAVYVALVAVYLGVAWYRSRWKVGG